MKLKAKYQEVYYRDIRANGKVFTVWGFYNFDSGYGLVKKYMFDCSSGGFTYHDDIARDLRPSDTYLTSVKAIKNDVEDVIHHCRATEENWESLDDGKDQYLQGGK